VQPQDGRHRRGRRGQTGSRVRSGRTEGHPQGDRRREDPARGHDVPPGPERDPGRPAVHPGLHREARAEADLEALRTVEAALGAKFAKLPAPEPPKVEPQVRPEIKTRRPRKPRVVRVASAPVVQPAAVPASDDPEMDAIDKEYDTTKKKMPDQPCTTRLDTRFERAEGRRQQIIASLWHGPKRPDVEEVQRLVIQQLWAEGLFDAAEHYQNYREAHRKARLTRPIAPGRQARVRPTRSTSRPTSSTTSSCPSSPAGGRRNAAARRGRSASTTGSCPGSSGCRRPGQADRRRVAELADAMYDLEASPAMRVVQMAGPALDRCNVGAYNCAYAPLDDLFSLPRAALHPDAGHRAGVLGRDEYVSELPRIKKQKGLKPGRDARRRRLTEGWCDVYHEGCSSGWWDGHDARPDDSGVRQEGRPPQDQGRAGQRAGAVPGAPGLRPQPDQGPPGRFLEDTDAHRLACFTGKIVQVGGVRRAALLSLSDLDSLGMRTSSRATWYPAGLWADGRTCPWPTTRPCTTSRAACRSRCSWRSGWPW
jgi:hypothetical protein